MSALLWWMVQNALVVAILVAVVLPACRLLRHRPAVCHALWLVVLVKFVTPPLVVWPWSLAEIGEQAVLFVGPQDEATAVQSVGRTLDSVPPSSPSLIAGPADSLITGSELLIENGIDVKEPFPAAQDQAFTPATAVNSQSEEVQVSQAGSLRHWRLVLPLIFGLWVTGCLWMVVVQVRRTIRQRAIVLRGVAAPDCVAREVGDVSKRLRMRPVRTLVVEGLRSPFLWCVGWLRLVWPELLADGTSLARSRGIIAHELAHVRRRDHLVTWLELVAGIIWWWNPLFWFVRGRLREASEMACDAIALSVCDDRREYAETFLEMSSSFKTGAPAPVLGVSTGTPSSFERRMSMILNDRVSGKLSVCGLLFCAGIAAVALPSWSLAQTFPNDAKVQNSGTVAPDSRFAENSNYELIEPRFAPNSNYDEVTIHFAENSNFEEIAPKWANPIADRTEVFFAQNAGFDDALRRAVLRQNFDAIQPQNARETAEVFLTVSQLGKWSDARKLAVQELIRTGHLGELSAALAGNSVISLKVDTVHTNEPGEGKEALVVTKAIVLAKPEPNGISTGRLVLRMVKKGDRWLVSDIDFETEETAKEELDRFLKDFPEAKPEPLTAQRGVPLLQNLPHVGRLFSVPSENEADPSTYEFSLLQDDGLPRTTGYQVIRFRKLQNAPEPRDWAQNESNMTAYNMWAASHLLATPQEIGQRLNAQGAGLASGTVIYFRLLDEIKDEVIRAAAEEVEASMPRITFLPGEMVLIRRIDIPAVETLNSPNRVSEVSGAGTDGARQAKGPERILLALDVDAAKLKLDAEVERLKSLEKNQGADAAAALGLAGLETPEQAGFVPPAPSDEVKDLRLNVKLLEIELLRAELRLQLFDQRTRRTDARDQSRLGPRPDAVPNGNRPGPDAVLTEPSVPKPVAVAKAIQWYQIEFNGDPAKQADAIERLRSRVAKHQHVQANDIAANAHGLGLKVTASTAISQIEDLPDGPQREAVKKLSRGKLSIPISVDDGFVMYFCPFPRQSTTVRESGVGDAIDAFDGESGN